MVNTSASPCRAAPCVKSNRYHAPKSITVWSDEKPQSAKCVSAVRVGHVDFFVTLSATR